jgi:putative ABC transport system permease protein
MFKNYLVTALRNLARRKQYTLLSILVMVIGLTTAFLTLLYARYEFSYDQWLSDADRLYRIENSYHFPGSIPTSLSRVGRPFGPALAAYFPQIESFTRSVQLQSNIRVGESRFNDPVELVDANFFSFFDLELLRGDREASLGDVGAMLISERIANKYFGGEDPLGRIVTVNDLQDYRISGVMKNLPDNTHLSHEIVALYDDSAFTPFIPNLPTLEQWNLPIFQTHLKLSPGADAGDIDRRLGEFTDSHYVHPNPARAGMRPGEFVTLKLRPVRDIHLYSDNIDELVPAGTFNAVMGLVIIAFLILAAVIINYVNLATALSTLRAREISLRKTLGAGNLHIRTQFILEAIILALASMGLSLFIVELTLPWFSAFLKLAPETLLLFSDPVVLGTMCALSITLGLLSGLYPALYLSRIRPVEVLSANNSSEKVTARIRSLLVTLQFAVSIGLLIAIYIVFRQTSFVTQMDIGVETDNIAIVRLPTLETLQALPQLVGELERTPGVLALGASSTVPTDGQAVSTAVEVPWAPTEDALSAWWASVDEGFFETYGVETLTGRTFSDAFPADLVENLPDDMDGFEAHVLVNESALAFLSLDSASEAIGKRFRMGGSNFNNALFWVTIIGVVPDFHFGNAYSEIQPTFFMQRADFFASLSVRTTAGAFNDVQQRIDELWARFLPAETLTRQALTELIGAQYDAIDRQGDSLLFLAIVAMVISCLGLFGMSSFMVERRTREIGVRKVMGARVSQIVTLLLMQFSRPVVWANLIAWPIAWYLMRDWLDGFSYRIELSPMPFALAGLTSLTIAWVIVGIHALKAARANPVHALRYE